MPDKWDQFAEAAPEQKDKWDQFAQPSGPDALTQKSQAAQRSVGVDPNARPPIPSAAQANTAGAKYLNTLDPQSRYTQEHGTDVDPEFGTKGARLESGSSMAIPAAVMSLGTTAPAATIARKGIAGYAAPLVRAGLKAYAGSKVGGEIGSVFGPKGRTVGSVAGSLAGPMVSGQSFARLPFGAGRIVASDEEYAAARAAQKIAQRSADVNAGLRKPPLETPPIGPQMGEVTTPPAEQYQPVKGRVSEKFTPGSTENPSTTGSASKGGPSARLGSPYQQELASRSAAKVAPPPGKIVEPTSPPPHVEGSYWSFKETDLRNAVLKGDRDAAIVYKERFGRLPPGANYLTDVGAQPNRGLYRSANR